MHFLLCSPDKRQIESYKQIGTPFLCTITLRKKLFYNLCRIELWCILASLGSILLGDYLICMRCSHTIVPTSEEGTGLNNGLFCCNIKKNHRCKPRTSFRAPVREMKRRLLSCFLVVTLTKNPANREKTYQLVHVRYAI